MGIVELKDQLRMQAKKNRATLSCAYKIDAQQLIYAKFIDYLSNLSHHSRVGLYWSNDDELDVRPLLEILYKQNRSVSLPRVKGSRMFFVDWTPATEMVENSFLPFSEPNSDVEVQPDLIVVPLLICDKLGHRLGYGKGHYDRYLSENSKVIKVGFCYGKIISADKIPQEDHDVKLDAVITENQIY